jgi:hypothetical protein
MGQRPSRGLLGCFAKPDDARRAAALALEVFEQTDLLTSILRLAAAPGGLLVTKQVAIDAPAAAPALRRLI